MANKKNGGKATKNETKNAQPTAEQVTINANEVGTLNLGETAPEASAPKAESKPAGVAALDALFAEAGMNPASGKKKTDEYQTKNLAADKRVEGESINKQHEAWTEAYQKQRIAAVKLGKYRTAILGLPAGIRKFNQGKFRPGAGWDEAAKKLDPETLKKYLEMEAAVEALA